MRPGALPRVGRVLNAAGAIRGPRPCAQDRGVLCCVGVAATMAMTVGCCSCT
eukprot:COSAG06_NODE_11_length_35482_cov_68.929888_28_plen_52_part_00